MISRGEVALIVASKETTLGLLGSDFSGPIIIVVVITTVITPILLKFVFKFGPNKQPMDDSTIEKVTFSDNYEELEN